ncbi:LysR family transcriptional regulator [Pontivivens ytuae]|uniref:LysR family transcriptional regulator n=1 Tax=Pontivivens ytuae TaxID=2789856 RepID=A0A7S9LTE2_9RHOB|nr:LysR family transcriptional regulator [Pontivivens ytuae]QPH54946.1 LysR family transcriptional regulator [Pontivivens ytuae]
MNWNDLRFFLAVSRSGSLSEAARQIGTSPSRVSRRIEALEAALGIPLFLRSPDGYRLTDQGAEFVPRAEQVETAALSLSGKAAFCAGIAGRVRLATAENLATRLLAPALPGFLQAHPNLTLELVTGVRSLDLARYDADLALRLVRPTSAETRIRKLGHMACAVYIAVDADPPGFVCWSAEMGDLPVARAVTAMKSPVAIVSNSLAAHHELAAAGAVRAVLPCFIGDADPRLRRIGGIVESAGQDIWLAINKDVAASARIRAVADFVVDVVTRNALQLAPGPTASPAGAAATPHPA